MDPAPRQFLDRFRSTLKRVVLVDGLFSVIAWTLLAALAVVLLDRLNSLPVAIRVPMLCVLVAIAVSVAVKRLWRPLRQSLDDHALARIAERRVPEFNGRLFAAVDDLPLGPDDRSALQQACVPSTIQRLIRHQRMLRSTAAGGSLLLVLALAAVLAPQSAWIAAQRLFLPLGNAEWPRQHSLQVRLESPVVAVDQPLVVIAEGQGSAAALRLTWVDETGHQESRVPNALNGPWRERLNLEPGRYQFSATWGDSLPVAFTGIVVERPRLSHIQAHISPPDYTGLAAESLTAPAEIAALPGSSIKLQFNLEDAADQALRDVGLWLDDQSLAVQRSAEGWQASWIFSDQSSVEVDVADTYAQPHQTVGGDAQADAAIDAPQIAVQVKPRPSIALRSLIDRAPMVRVAGPRRNETVMATAIVPLSVIANDDYGLASVVLNASVLTAGTEVGEQGDATQLAEWGDVTGIRGETRRQHAFRVGELIGAGYQLAVIAEATDANDVTGPGVGFSDPLLLRVVTESELRQELDRLIVDVRDRLVQARDQVAPGLTDEDQLVEAARSARPIAERAVEQLFELERRWSTNQLEVEVGDQLSAIRAMVADEAVPQLNSGIVSKIVEPVAVADRVLGQAERALTRLLRSDDLARELSTLMNRQQQLSEVSRELIQAQLSGSLGPDGQQQLDNAALRQQEVADQLREWIRRLVSDSDDDLTAAQALARSAQPAAALQRAAEALGAQRGRQAALGEQRQAEDTMQAMLDLLRGEETDQELADLAGDLAARQERLQNLLEQGGDPQALSAEQERLREETEEFAERLRNESENEEAAESVDGAAAAQAEAQSAMQGGQRSSAAREAAAAAAQLRAAQRSLQGEDNSEQAEQEQDEQNPVVNIEALIRRLAEDQTRIVTKATELVAKGVGVDQAALDFQGRRQVRMLANQQELIYLELQAEALEALADMPLALRAVQRLVAAVEPAFDHLDQPALGERGLRLTKIALYEFARVLSIIDSMPEPAQSSSGDQQGQGGESTQAPFPPAAQLALLAAEQAEVRQLTAARVPKDLPQAQQELLELATLVERQTRPGTRPAVLMQRATRAMASATDLLKHNELPATVLSEQDAAVAMIYRMMAEAQGSPSSGGGGSSSPQEQQGQQGQQGQEQQADRGDGQSEGLADGQQSGDAQNADGQGQGDETTTVETDLDDFPWMELAPVGRDQLREARGDNVPAEGLHLYRAYLEILEDMD